MFFAPRLSSLKRLPAAKAHSSSVGSLYARLSRGSAKTRGARIAPAHLDDGPLAGRFILRRRGAATFLHALFILCAVTCRRISVSGFSLRLR